MLIITLSFQCFFQTILDDGVHIGERAIDLLISKLFLPFFISQTKPQVTDDLYLNKTSPYDVEVHMFPFSNYDTNLILSK